MINLKIVNKSSEKSVNIDIKNIVNNYTDSVVFSDIVTNRNVNIAYYEVPAVNSIDNIKISKANTGVKFNHANWFDIEDNIFEVTTKKFFLPYKDCLITNVLSEPNQLGQRVPLFYKHKTNKKFKEANLSWKRSINRLGSDFEFKLLDGVLYSNSQNKFDEKTSHYNICFVTGVYEDDTVVNEIFNPEPVAKEITWQDIDESTGEVKKGLLRFEKSVNEAQKYFEYNILYDRFDNLLELNCLDEESLLNLRKFYIKGLTSNIIEINKPEEYSLNNPWHITITNGEFFVDQDHYKVAEYEKQMFNPFFGSKYAIDKRCFFITNSMIKLPYHNLLLDSQNDLFFTLYEKDQDESVLNVYTNNPSLKDKYYRDGITKYIYVDFKADELNSIVYSLVPLNSLYLYTADFYFESKNYQYVDLDFNFTNNEDFINYYYAILIRPNKLNLDLNNKENTESIKYLKIDYRNTVYDSNLIDWNDLSSVQSYVGAKYETVLNSLKTEKYLLLGEIKSSEYYRSKDIFNFDLRKYDYTNKFQYDLLLEANHKILQSKYGYGEEGQILQRNNVLHIEVPYEILSSYSGEYELISNDQVKNISVEEMLRNRLPLSRDIVLTTLTEAPDINAVALTTIQNKITFSWEGLGTYKIYSRLSNDYKDEKRTVTTIISESRPEFDKIEYIDPFTTTSSIEAGTTLYYTIEYNNGPESVIIGVKKAL